jgi:hypothetical protein
MRVLLTNYTMNGRSGSETYTRDLALGLLAAGVHPVVYSPVLGPLARELQAATVPVVDRLECISEPPDVIHGHHHEETAKALLRFPEAPALFVIHDWQSWHDLPLPFPQIRRFVAVDQTRRDRLVLTHGVSPDRVTVVPNTVDTARFLPRNPLPHRPERALVFSNYLTEPSEYRDLHRACQRHGVDLNLAGEGVGRPLAQPELALGDYDLVFGLGRSAMEAMAVGSGVIIWGLEGLGGFVNKGRFQRFVDCNFGRRLLKPATRQELEAAIADYDAREAGAVQALLRQTFHLNGMVAHYLALYEELIAENRARPVPLTSTLVAAADYLENCVPRPQVESLLGNKGARSARRIRRLVEWMVILGLVAILLFCGALLSEPQPIWLRVGIAATGSILSALLWYFRSMLRARSGQLGSLGVRRLFGL